VRAQRLPALAWTAAGAALGAGGLAMLAARI
jgi:hypothetical protein